MADNGSILLRRGPTGDRKNFTPLSGEAIYDTNQKVFYIGDGETAGGSTALGDNVTIDDDGNLTSILLSDPSNTRPSPVAGLIRFNEETKTLEYSDGDDYYLLGASPFNSITNVLYVSPNGKDDDTFKDKKGRTPGTAFRTLNRACREAEAIIKGSAKGLGPYQKFITYDSGSGQQFSIIDTIVDASPYINLDITNGGTQLDATQELRSGFRVIGQTSGAIGIIEEYNVPGGLTDQLVVDVESGTFQVGEKLKFGSAIPSTPYVSGVQSIPEITIFVETGIYYEHFPIRVPVNTSIKGDEFRRSIIRPQPGMSNSSYADIGFKRDADKLGYDPAVVGARPFGRHYTTDYTNRIYPFIENEGGYDTEVAIIRQNKKTLIDQTILFIESNYPNLDYNEDKCRRDSGLIIDALVFDLENGEYNGTLNAGLAYYGQAAYLPTDQVVPTAASIDHLATRINSLLNTAAVESIVTNYVGGIAEIIRDNNFNRPKDNEDLDVFLLNDATIIRNITVQQHGGFMEVLDPVGQIKTRSPYTQTASSFSRSRAPEVSFAGGMFVDGFCGNLDARIVQANSITEIVIDNVDREPQAPTSFYVNGTRFQINKVDTVGVSTGQYRVLLDTSTPWQASYYQIVNSGDPLPTLPLDIEILTAGNISILSNDYTQINDLGYGLYVTNGARAEAVSVFTYYCHIAYLSENGADIRSLNGSCGYGDFALVARGSDPLETSDEVNLSENTIQTALTHSAGAFAGSNEEGDLQIIVDGFAYEPFNVTEVEIDHNGATDTNGDAYEIVRYAITGFTETSDPNRIQLNLNTAGNNDTATSGLKTDVPNDTRIIIRCGQVVQIENVIDVNPTRPSTALVYQDDPDTVYRVLAYDTAGLAANTAKVTLRETYDYIKAIVDTTAGSVAGSGQSGDTTVRLEVDLDANEESRVEASIAAGLAYQFGFAGVIHTITGYRTKSETGQPYAELDFTPGLTKSMSSFTETVTLRAGPQAGQAADITVGISTLRATSHDLLDIGTGSFQSSNYPSEIFGSPQIAKDQSKEVVEENKGRVFFVTSDQDGNFRVGDFFKVDQGTGTVTFAASIALSNLDGIGFKRGVAISEFSTDDAMTDSATDTVPTESAVLNYVGRRLGLSDTNAERTDKIGSGFLDLGGIQSMQGDINMNSNSVNNIAAPTSDTQAANKGYVDSKTFEVNSKNSTVDGSITLVTDDIQEDGSPTNLYFTTARSRNTISVNDTGGDGSLSYNSGTGVISYTGPSPAEARAHFSAANTGTGEGELTYTQSTGVYSFAKITDAAIRGKFGATGNLAYDSSTGIFSFNDAVVSVNGITGAVILNTDNVAEGNTRQYFTNVRWDTRLATKTTDDLAEGSSNLYYTQEKVDDRMAAVLVAGTNMDITYDDAAGTIEIATVVGAQGYDLSANDTNNLSEGTSNLYYTNERVDDRVQALIVPGEGIDTAYDDGLGRLTISGEDATTANKGIASFNSNHFTVTSGAVSVKVDGIDATLIDFGTGTDQINSGNIPEGTNLYYTNERVDDRVNALFQEGTNISFVYNDAAGTFTINASSVGGYDLSANDTDDLSEGATNLYYTNTRVRSAISATTGSAGYNSSTGVFTIPSTTNHITEDTNLFYTDARVRSAISVSGDLSYDSSTGVISTQGLASSDTDDLAEGTTNLYYTNTRVDARISNALSGNNTIGGNLIVSGNLTVSGTQTNINTETLEVDDNIILLNQNKSGAPGSETVGIEVERGTGTNVQLRWNDSSDVWELTTDGSTYETIATTVDVSAAAENDYVNSASFTTGTGVLTLTRLSGTDVTVDLDGRFHQQGVDIPDADISESSVTQHQSAINTGVSITESQISDLQSYLTAESDTLSSVLGRGNTANTNILPDSTANNRNLGSASAKWNTVYASVFDGTATNAQYADLAEIYDSDVLYPTGTAICVGGDREVTACDSSKMCIGVISAEPAFLMNKDADGQAVALKGRVPVRVVGPVQKGQTVYAWEAGYCTTTQTTALVGIALETSDVNTEKLIECVLKV